MSNCKFDRGRLTALHSIYVIRGPSGVYVGSTIKPKQRWCSHRANGRGPSTRNKSLLAQAMKRDGADRYTMEVVAQVFGFVWAGSVEHDVIRQLRAAGERVLNVVPRTPQHLPQYLGRTTYVVHGGQRCAL